MKKESGNTTDGEQQKERQNAKNLNDWLNRVIRMLPRSWLK